MVLSEYIEQCKAVFEEYGDLELVYASDDEGNDFQKVNWGPSVGVFMGDYRGDFIPEDNLEEHYDYINEDLDDDEQEEIPAINAVCIN